MELCYGYTNIPEYHLQCKIILRTSSYQNICYNHTYYAVLYLACAPGVAAYFSVLRSNFLHKPILLFYGHFTLLLMFSNYV